jgi:K+-transporting ATPase ATPase C chain
MKSLIAEIRIAILATLALTLILCGIYPAVVSGLAVLAFPGKANGSLVYKNGVVIGSSLIGQNFTGARYFHPRPSAAGEGWDAANSGGSNLGPLSKKLVSAVDERVRAYRAENGLADGEPVPADAVTASGSGLDPHISVRNAVLQAGRVARARGMSEAAVLRLVEARTEGPDLGILGEARVNVLELNMELEHGR